MQGGLTCTGTFRRNNAGGMLGVRRMSCRSSADGGNSASNASTGRLSW